MDGEVDLPDEAADWMPASTIPLRVLRTFCDQFTSRCWDIDRSITHKEVAEALACGRLSGFLADGHVGASRGWHIGRVAWFVAHRSDDPISLDVGVPSMGVPLPIWPVDDGNHRMAAALFRGDITIAGHIGGSVSYGYALGLDPHGRVQQELHVAEMLAAYQKSDQVVAFHDVDGIACEVLPILDDGERVITMIQDPGVHDLSEVVTSRIMGSDTGSALHGDGATYAVMSRKEFIAGYGRPLIRSVSDANAALAFLKSDAIADVLRNRSVRIERHGIRSPGCAI